MLYVMAWVSSTYCFPRDVALNQDVVFKYLLGIIVLSIASNFALSEWHMSLPMINHLLQKNILL